MLTDEQMAALFPNFRGVWQVMRRKVLLIALNQHCSASEINTPIRLAAFLGQVGHESGGLRFLAEIWGPTPQQLRYEPPTPLARNLGNTQPGDGRRYKGRGLIQITGRSNYRQMADWLRIDLVARPELLETPDLAVRSACVWWHSRRLNDLADINTEDAYRRITRTINGGLNGWEDRLRRWREAQKILIDKSFS